MNIGVDATASVNITDIKIFISAEIPILNTGHLKLNDLQITDLGKIAVYFDAYIRPLDWAVGKLMGFFANKIKDWLASVLEGPLRNIIKKILEKMPVSYQDIQNLKNVFIL